MKTQQQEDSLHESLLKHDLDVMEQQSQYSDSHSETNRKSDRFTMYHQEFISDHHGAAVSQSQKKTPVIKIKQTKKDRSSMRLSYEQMVESSHEYLEPQKNEPSSEQIETRPRRASVRFQFKKKQSKKGKHRSKHPQTSSASKPPLNLPHNTLRQRFTSAGLKLRSDWQYDPTSKSRQYTLNNLVFHLQEKIMRILYYFNFLVNTIFRLTLLSILVLMIVYEQQYQLMQIIISLEFVALILYSLAMAKFLYTKKDDQSVFFQKQFYDRDITEIEMEKVFRNLFTWENIVANFTAFFRCGTKFNKNIKISFMRQEIFKRMQIVLCFVPFLIFFFFSPKLFRFECEFNVQLIATGVISLEFFRLGVHYMIIFIYS